VIIGRFIIVFIVPRTIIGRVWRVWRVGGVGGVGGVRGVRDIVSIGGLLLFLRLVTTLDLALVEATLDAKGERIWDRRGNPHHLVNSDITKRGIDDLRWNPEEPLGNGRSTRVHTVQTSHEADGLAVQVRLEVEGSLGEDGTLTRAEDVGDESRPVVSDETDFKARPRYHVEEFSGTRVKVRRGQSARRHLTDSQRHALTEEVGEVCKVGDGDISASSLDNAYPSIEVKDEIASIE
jgi:hypothetical protein